MKNKNFVLHLVICLLMSCFAFAEEDPSGSEQKDIDFVENLLENNANTFKDTTPPATTSLTERRQKAEYNGIQTATLYNDLATIQKSYMPKSRRVQISGGFTLLPSDVFYRTFGVNAKASYHFNEMWGLELFGYAFTSSEREEVGELKDKQGLGVKSLVSVSSFYGTNIYFNSIYGKTSLFNNKIIPFEIYQTFGIGKVRTGNSEESTSIQVGIGDVFSLSRSTAFKVDLTWAFYNATNYLGKEQASNSLFLTLSYGRFYPEPDYR